MDVDILKRLLPLSSQWLMKDHNTDFVHSHTSQRLEEHSQNVASKIEIPKEVRGNASFGILHDSIESMASRALLFQAAVSYSQEGKCVTLISKEHFSQLPPSVHGMPRPNSAAMKHLKITYASSLDALSKILCELHKDNSSTQVVIIPEISEYFSHIPSDDSNYLYTLSRLCALIGDSAGYLERYKNGAVLFSSYDANFGHLPVFQRFHTSLYTLQCDFLQNKPLCLKSIAGNLAVYLEKNKHEYIMKEVISEQL